MSDYTEFSLIADSRIKVIAPSESCFVNIKEKETAIRFRNVYGGGIVYDPFMGTGTTAVAAIEHKMDFIGSEISAEYCDYANNRIGLRQSEPGLF